MTSETKFIHVNSVELGYQVHAEGSGLPPLLFAHGYALRSTGPMYRELFSNLTGNFTVYALDLRGHGASADAFADWSCEALADDVAAFADALGIAGAVYAGHSIGGFTGMFATIRHPGVFSALCLLATAPASAGRYTATEHGDVFLKNGADVEAMHEIMGAAYVRAAPEEVRHAAESVAIMNRQVHEAFFPNFIHCEITQPVEAIREPCLVLNGLQDNIVPPAEQHATALGLPVCKEVNFSSEGHMFPIEAPGLTAREIVNFHQFGLTP